MNRMLIERYQESLQNLENVYAGNLIDLHERLKGLEEQFKRLLDALDGDGRLSGPDVQWSEVKK